MKHVGRKEQKINECFQLRRGLVLTQHKATATMHTHTHTSKTKKDSGGGTSNMEHIVLLRRIQEKRGFSLFKKTLHLYLSVPFYFERQVCRLQN